MHSFALGKLLLRQDFGEMNKNRSEYQSASGICPPIMRGLSLTVLNSVFNCPDYQKNFYPASAPVIVTYYAAQRTVIFPYSESCYLLGCAGCGAYARPARCSPLIYLNLFASINHREWGHLQVTTDNLNRKYREKFCKASG